MRLGRDTSKARGPGRTAVMVVACALPRSGNRLLALGEQMEQAFIWDSLDLTTADAASTEAWWREAVTFPEDFSYEVGAR